MRAPWFRRRPERAASRGFLATDAVAWPTPGQPAGTSVDPLTGPPTGAPGNLPAGPASGPLAELLAAAAAPATPDELAGETDVMAAFARSRRAASRLGRRSTRSRLAKLLTSNIAIAVLAGSTAGGVAAAAIGLLPNPFHGGDSGGPSPSISPAPILPLPSVPGQESATRSGIPATEPPGSPLPSLPSTASPVVEPTVELPELPVTPPPSGLPPLPDLPPTSLG